MLFIYRCTNFPQLKLLHFLDTATLEATLITPQDLRLGPVGTPLPRRLFHPHRMPGWKGGFFKKHVDGFGVLK